jgi:anti-sigma28 factor (negative regulator of flagellin synthesis)
MALNWVAEKLRRAERIKTELSEGTYQVDSAKVAQAIVDTSHNDGADSRR